MSGLAAILLVIALVAVAGLLLGGVGGITAVLLVAGLAGAVYLLRRTRRRS